VYVNFRILLCEHLLFCFSGITALCVIAVYSGVRFLKTSKINQVSIIQSFFINLSLIGLWVNCAANHGMLRKYTMVEHYLQRALFCRVSLSYGFVYG